MAILTATRRRAASLLRAGIVAGLAAVSVPAAPAQPAGADYQIKAVFLYNFTEFVQWPKTAFADAQAPMVIGVLGDDPFGPYLDEAVRGEKSKGRAIVVRHFRLVEEIGPCHILFISRSEAARLDAIFASLRGRSILLVSDADRFAEAGGMVQFTTTGGRVRLRVNPDAARAAHLAISSKLLRAVELVHPKKR